MFDWLILFCGLTIIFTSCSYMESCQQEDQMFVDYCEKKQGRLYNDICVAADGSQIMWPDYLEELR